MPDDAPTMIEDKPAADETVLMVGRMLATAPPPPGCEWAEAWGRRRAQIAAEMARRFERQIYIAGFVKNPFMKFVERAQRETHA